MALNTKPLDKVRSTVPVQEIAKPAPEELVRVAVQVDKDTRKEWQMEALQRDLTLSDLIRNAMRDFLHKNPIA